MLQFGGALVHVFGAKYVKHDGVYICTPSSCLCGAKCVCCAKGAKQWMVCIRWRWCKLVELTPPAGASTKHQADTTSASCLLLANQRRSCGKRLRDGARTEHHCNLIRPSLHVNVNIYIDNIDNIDDIDDIDKTITLITVVILTLPLIFRSISGIARTQHH